MNKKFSILISLVVLSVVLANIQLEAQTVPPLINYQGKLVSSNGLPVSTATTNCVSALFNAEVAKVYAEARREKTVASFAKPPRPPP